MRSSIRSDNGTELRPKGKMSRKPKLSIQSAWLLRHLASLHPRGLCATNPMPCHWREQPDMTNMRGLMKRGWAKESSIGGIFYITEAGLAAAAALPPTEPIDQST